MSLTIARTEDLDACHALRRIVFMGEQQVSAEDEWDGQDEGAWHYLARNDGRAVGSLRVLLNGDAGILSRVCVLADQRGLGVGAALTRAAVADLRAAGCRAARLGAQTQALAFYERLGFVAEGPEFIDAGIPHRWMAMRL